MVYRLLNNIRQSAFQLVGLDSLLLLQAFEQNSSQIAMETCSIQHMEIHSVMYSWFVFCIVIALEIQEAHSTGFVELEFVSYLNENNGKADGQCCELGTSVCRYDCNNVFSICLSNTTTMQSCQYGSYTSDIVSSDNLNFDNNEFDSNLASPYKFSFDKWQGKVTTKIDVNLKDNGGLISPFPQTTLPVKPSLFNTSTSQSLPLSWKKRRSRRKEKRLILKYKVECDEDYLLPDCYKKHCTPQNDVRGHYNCSERGEKICLDGWLNPITNCTTVRITSSSTVLMPSSSPQMMLIQVASTSEFYSSSEMQYKASASKISSIHITASSSSVVTTTFATPTTTTAATTTPPTTTPLATTTPTTTTAATTPPTTTTPTTTTETTTLPTTTKPTTSTAITTPPTTTKPTTTTATTTLPTTTTTTKNKALTENTKSSTTELPITTLCPTTPAKSVIIYEIITYTIAGSVVFLAVVITLIFLMYYKNRRKRRIIRPERMEIAPINNNSDCAKKTDCFFKGPSTTNVVVYNY